ncbi:hypothetical protein [Granulosicoccus antarcticus]|uniref:J domain-containing protein n=1 Tax=Granulosicoccus antarcticus IMCC3135 TaxID=1192854 RepID=A0A2Z2NW74_9GAMM|nr:hypothetical protein [Granulosicoccus antarcticus]ASJ73958.1 hypothetical protein IMCC3135_19395 [Granulosicoccus antarcticus IMCC3135]
MSNDSQVWVVLGLEQPTGGTQHDSRAVKKAYAKALKAIDQSADPAGFQMLRESYERALELVKVVKVEELWRRFAADIGTSPSQIVQIDELIGQEGNAVYPESQIALDALGDMGRVAVLDQSADSVDACFVLNALLARSGAVAVTEEVLAAIEQKAEAIWHKSIDDIETPVEYVAARFSVIAAEQRLALLSIHDEGENMMFAIATQDAGQGWIGKKLGAAISIFAVVTVSESPADDPVRFGGMPGSRAESHSAAVGKAELFHGDRPPQPVEADTYYAAYVRMVENAMAVDSEEEDWIRLFDKLDNETPEMREDVESMVFRTLLETQRSADGPGHLPPSFTANVVEALDEQFQWLSDGAWFERKFQQDSNVMVIALQSVRGRKVSFSKVPQKPNVLIVSLMCVVAYAIVRTLFTWLTTHGVIS